MEPLRYINRDAKYANVLSFEWEMSIGLRYSFVGFGQTKDLVKVVLKAIKGQKQNNDIYMYISLHHDTKRNDPFVI